MSVARKKPQSNSVRAGVDLPLDAVDKEFLLALHRRLQVDLLLLHLGKLLLERVGKVLLLALHLQQDLFLLCLELVDALEQPVRDKLALALGGRLLTWEKESLSASRGKDKCAYQLDRHTAKLCILRLQFGNALLIRKRCVARIGVRAGISHRRRHDGQGTSDCRLPLNDDDVIKITGL